KFPIITKCVNRIFVRSGRAFRAFPPCPGVAIHAIEKPRHEPGSRMTDDRRSGWPRHPAGMAPFSASANLTPAFVCVAALAATHAMFRLGALPHLWTVATIGVVALVAWLAPYLDLRSAEREPPTRLNWLVGVIVVAPGLLSLILGVNRDFPFSG